MADRDTDPPLAGTSEVLMTAAIVALKKSAGDYSWKHLIKGMVRGFRRTMNHRDIQNQLLMKSLLHCDSRLHRYVHSAGCCDPPEAQRSLSFGGMQSDHDQRTQQIPSMKLDS